MPRMQLSDHPRACGELARGLTRPSRQAGSSPRMRGTQVHDRAVRERPHGSSPRMRGTLDEWSLSDTSSTDHPRACGELLAIPKYFAVHSVDHPRACGELSFQAPEAILGRHDPDHPRACGELWTGDHPRGPAGAGSSPRMRGTPAYRPRPPILLRIIPAHAGNSGVRGGAYVLESDHPRACGELSWNEETPAWETGSSPRMRGTHPAVRVTHNLARIIPAHAGNSLAGHRMSVHRTGQVGSSPRMRGTLIRRAS